MRTPEEIKKGLYHCSVVGNETCLDCPYDDGHIDCARDKNLDALAYIQQLESRLAQVERERDALLDYLGDSTCAPCDICKHDVGSGVMGCKRIREIGIPCFEWRGVCAENTEEE